MLKRWIRRPIAWLARLVGALLALGLVLSAALVFYSTTADFHARLLARAVPELDARMAGDLSVGGSEGSPFSSLRLRDVALDWHGETIVRLPSVRVALDWPALLAGRLRIAAIELESPQVVFREHATEGWDWRAALAPLVPPPDRARPPRDEPLRLVIERLGIEQGTLRIEPLHRPPITVTPIDARAAIDFGAKHVALEHLALAPGATRLVGQGEIPFQGRWQVDVGIEALDPRDLARVVPQLGERLDAITPATGRVALSGERKQITALGQLEWPGAKLVFDVRGAPDPLAAPDPPSVPDPLAAPDPPSVPDSPAVQAGRIVARLEARSLGEILRDAPLAGRVEARIELEAGEGRYAARLAPEGGGSLEAEGTLALRPALSTQSHIRLDRFDPARAWPARAEWQGALSGAGSLALQGRDASELVADLDFELAASRVGTLALTGGRIEAKLTEGVVEPFSLALESRSGRVDVRGRISTRSGRPVSLAAKLDLDDLAPLFALAGREGGGSLRGTIDFDGRASDGRLETSLALEGLALDGMTLEQAHLTLDARGDFAGSASAAGLDVIVQTARLEGAFGDWALETPTRVRAGADSLALADARFASGAARLSLDGRIARRGEQTLRLVGRALPIADWARLRSDLVPSDALTAGTLDLELALGGTAARPSVALHLAPRDLALAARPIERVDAKLDYDAGRLAAKLAASTPPGLRLDAEAALPFALAWSDAIVARPTGPLSARVEGDANDLALLEPFFEGRVSDLGGEAHGSIELAGPLDALRPSGELTARGLTGRPQRTGVTIVGGELAVELAADRFYLRRATATAEGHEQTARFEASGEGPLPAALTRWMEALATPDSGETYTTRIELVRWPLVDTRRNHLVASGVLTARGTFEAPRVEGHVEIVEGTLRPDLNFLSSGPPPRDPTIELAMPEDAKANGNRNGSANGRTNGNANGAGNGGNGPNLLSSFDALALDVKLDIGRDLWIKHEQAEVLLSGHVAARKQPGRDLSLEGRIEAERGFAELQNRRFRLIEGSIELVGGGKIDPILNVLGRHRTRDYTIDARLTGTASNPVLTLSSDPSLSQEDILAVLLFGRPTGELTSDQQTTLGERAATLASSIGLSVVGRGVASALHLDAIGLQIDELSSQRASVGAYVGRNIFVALAQDFSGERGQELSIEYEFWPGWSLIGSTTSQGTNSAGLVWRVRY